MSNDHIISLIEENRAGALSPDQLSTIKSHVGNCPDCLKAYRASLVMGSLLKARASEIVEPPQFFQTRVMAFVKERDAVRAPAFIRLWKAAGALVSLMVVIVVVLSALTMLGAGSRPASTPVLQAQMNGSPLASINIDVENMLFDDDTDGDQITETQVLETVFVEETDGNQ